MNLYGYMSRLIEKYKFVRIMSNSKDTLSFNTISCIFISQQVQQTLKLDEIELIEQTTYTVCIN